MSTLLQRQAGKAILRAQDRVLKDPGLKSIECFGTYGNVRIDILPLRCEIQIKK